ncbi:low-density lipoprotein receptor domain class A domain-containing protein [Ditylenchus destructor]|uniref:Low-density lipoprotein receptor domain class A domain-containing protein n=1 Tax=Ditylenchus destructor TaxID=166010 RepID=A0AAD4R991_9BILA|nr:low-density lipoprotein receptor domain class A domain-containing protein [Ditylenchus destructor]
MCPSSWGCKSLLFTHCRISLLFLLLLVENIGEQQEEFLDIVQTRFPGCCAPEYFDCRPAGGGACIPLNKFHDGVVDCADGSDEACFPGQIRCAEYCAELKHLGECLRNPHCDPLTPSTSTGAPQIIIPPIVPREQAAFCPLLRRRLCGLTNTVSCKGYGECIFLKWLMDGKVDCLDGSDEDPEYAALFKVLAYVGNPINPSQVALHGLNPVPTNTPHQVMPISVEPISPVVPINAVVHGGGESVATIEYQQFTSVSPEDEWKPGGAYAPEGEKATSHTMEPVESTGTQPWQGPIIDDFGYPFARTPPSDVFSSRQASTISTTPTTHLFVYSNVTVTPASHNFWPTQEGWLVFPRPPGQSTGGQMVPEAGLISPVISVVKPPSENKNKSAKPTWIVLPTAMGPGGDGQGFLPAKGPLDAFYEVETTTLSESETKHETATIEGEHNETSTFTSQIINTEISHSVKPIVLNSTKVATTPVTFLSSTEPQTTKRNMTIPHEWTISLLTSPPQPPDSASAQVSNS